MLGILIAISLLVVTILFLAYQKWESSEFVKAIELIPGPKRKPIVGNATSLPKESEDIFRVFQEKWIEEFGRIYRNWVGFRPFINISTAPLLEKVMSSQQTFLNKSDSYNILKPWLGEGLLISSGNKWRKNRRLLTPAFHFQILDNFFDVYNRNAEILCDQLSASSNLDIEHPKEIDVYPFLKKCTLDVVCEAAMGIQVNAQLEDTQYIRNVDRLSEVVAARFFSIGLVLPDWLYHCTPSGREHLKIVREIHEFTLKVITDRKKEMALEEADDDNDENFTGIKKRRAFLDLMLLANKNEEVKLTDIEIRNEVDTFMFEGHDTTATSMVWFLYCMATNPQHQKLVHEELDQVFGGSDRSCSAEDATKLKYLECCIKESLRLYPPVPNIIRYVSEDTELGGYKIPAGASVSLQLYAIQRNEEYFPEPSTFNPERFQVKESIGRHPFAFVPFSAGPRNCIGQRFAMLEEKVLASTLLRRFRFTYDTEKHGPPIEDADIVLKPLRGMPLIITSLLP